MSPSELMQTKANEGNGAVRLRAGLLLAGSAAGLLVPVLWQPATASSTPGDPTGLVVVAVAWAAWALTIYLAVGTAIAAAGYLAGAPGLLRRLTPHNLRRFVEVAVGASSAAAVCLAPAVAYADRPAPGPAVSASPLDWPGLAPATTEPALPPPAAPVQSAPSTPSTPPHDPRPAARLEVRPGDSLW